MYTMINILLRHRFHTRLRQNSKPTCRGVTSFACYVITTVARGDSREVGDASGSCHKMALSLQQENKLFNQKTSILLSGLFFIKAIYIFIVCKKSE